MRTYAYVFFLAMSVVAAVPTERLGVLSPRGRLKRRLQGTALERTKAGDDCNVGQSNSISGVAGYFKKGYQCLQEAPSQCKPYQCTKKEVRVLSKTSLMSGMTKNFMAKTKDGTYTITTDTPCTTGYSCRKSKIIGYCSCMSDSSIADMIPSLPSTPSLRLPDVSSLPSFFERHRRSTLPKPS